MNSIKSLTKELQKKRRRRNQQREERNMWMNVKTGNKRQAKMKKPLLRNWFSLDAHNRNPNRESVEKFHLVSFCFPYFGFFYVGMFWHVKKSRLILCSGKTDLYFCFFFLRFKISLLWFPDLQGWATDWMQSVDWLIAKQEKEKICARFFFFFLGSLKHWCVLRRVLALASSAGIKLKSYKCYSIVSKRLNQISFYWLLLSWEITNSQIDFGIQRQHRVNEGRKLLLFPKEDTRTQHTSTTCNVNLSLMILKTVSNC